MLKRLRRFKRPPSVIVLTNYPYPQYKEQSMALGAKYFFDKAGEFHKIPKILTKMSKRVKKVGKESADEIRKIGRKKGRRKRGENK